MTRRGFRVPLILVLALTALSPAAVARSAVPDPVVPPSAAMRIGVIGALSGTKSPYGLAHRQGAELAASEINANGGILLGSGGERRPLHLIPVDDAGEMGNVGALAVDLIFRERVSALLGSVDSGCTHVLAMVAVKSRVPHLTCVATDPSLTRAGSPWTFRTLADDERQGEAVVRWLASQAGLRRVAILAGSSRYGRMGAKVVARRARAAGLTVAGPAFLPPDQASHPPVIDALLAQPPEAIVLWCLATEGRQAIAILRSRGFTGRIVGGDGLASPAFYAAGGEAVEGVLVTAPYDEESSRAGNQAFRRRFRERFGHDPDSFAAHAYDTIHLLAAAAARTSSPLTPTLSPSRGEGEGGGGRALAPTGGEGWGEGAFRERLRAALAALPAFPGVTGEIRFDGSGNDIRPVRLARCQGGRLVPVGDPP